MLKEKKKQYTNQQVDRRTIFECFERDAIKILLAHPLRHEKAVFLPIIKFHEAFSPYNKIPNIVRRRKRFPN